ncbi:MAG: hypothetical protein CL868_21215 [Cytophagaceae bacterium]|nr:hypothetical protein [Cytophagaceae bacterium]
MKTNKILFSVSVLAIILCAIYSCEIQEDYEYQPSGSTGKLGVTAWEYIQTKESLSLLEEAIKISGLEDVYQAADTHTFIAPANSAFEEYLEDNNYESLAEIPVPILRNALKYHIVKATVLFTDPDLIQGNNPLPYATENGQIMYLSHNSNFQGIINEGTSSQWTITTSNLEPTNGVIHISPSIVYFSAPSGDLNPPDASVVRDTITPLFDTFINGGSQSGSNFGSDQKLKVKNVTGDGEYDRKTYMMFDLKDFEKEGVITDVKLELAVSFTHAKGLSLDVYSVKDTLWTEMGLNFNNATLPDDAPIASITTEKIDIFQFDVTDFYNSIDNKGRIALVIDGEAGGDETDEFGSKESTTLSPPMLIATLASGDSSIELNTNTGFTVGAGGATALDNNILEVTGANPEDVIYTVEEIPVHGWLVKGASIMQVGDKFTQHDVEVMNLLYINDGSGSEDVITLSARDRAGSSIEPFNILVTVQ